MIVGRDWIWLHFPKCGGTTAEKILRRNFHEDPTVQFDDLNPSEVIWHENTIARSKRDPTFSTEGKQIICVLRRLPDWILSRVHYEASRPPYRTSTRKMIEEGLFFANNGYKNRADLMFNYYNSPEVSNWIRLESMQEDFEKFFNLALTPVEHALNKNKFTYVRATSFWFTDKQLEDLYSANPNWARAERLVYGSLLV